MQDKVNKLDSSFKTVQIRSEIHKNTLNPSTFQPFPDLRLLFFPGAILRG